MIENEKPEPPYYLADTLRSYEVCDIDDWELVPQVETAQFADERLLRMGNERSAK